MRTSTSSFAPLARPLAAAGLLAGLVVAGAAPANATQEEVLRDGKTEYRENCSGCHGLEGRGDGRMAEILLVKPTDLAGLAKSNDGEFPFWRVYRIIAGEEEVKGHLHMPLWLERFRRDEKKPGYPPAYMRILLITHYLESIQAD